MHIISQIQKTIKQPAIILIIITIVSKLLGFLRELVIANYFGANKALDIFLLAFTIPSIVISITMYAFSNSIIPKLGINDNSSHYNKVLAAIFRIYFFVSAILALVIFIGANFFINLIAHDISSSEIKAAIILMKYLSLYTLFFNFFNVFKSVYQSEKKFIFPAVTQFSVHISLIISVILFSKEYSYYSLLIGVVVGTAIQLIIISINFFKKKGFNFLLKYEKNIKIIDSDFILLITIEVINQAYLYIDRSFASTLPTGSISSLNYANILTQLPVSIFASSVGIVIFTKFRDNNSNGHGIIDKPLLIKIIGVILLFSIPAFIFYFIFPEFITRLIFMRGQFDEHALYLTVDALKYFAIGIPFIMIHVILTKYVFVIHKAKYVLFSNFTAILVKILIIYLTINNLQHASLALSSSIAFIVNILVLSIFLFFNNKKK